MRFLRSATFLVVILTLPSIAASQSVFISEILVGNERVYCDSFGDDPDWIELFNPTSAPVNMGGWTLTDGHPKMPLQHKWQFPSDVVIQPQGYLIVFVMNKIAAHRDGKELHITTFRLNAKEGEIIALLNPDGVQKHRIRFGKQNRNVSLGTSNNLEPAVPQKWPTPGLPNDAPRPPSRCPQ